MKWWSGFSSLSALAKIPVPLLYFGEMGLFPFLTTCYEYTIIARVLLQEAHFRAALTFECCCCQEVRK